MSKKVFEKKNLKNAVIVLEIIFLAVLAVLATRSSKVNWNAILCGINANIHIL